MHTIIVWLSNLMLLLYVASAWPQTSQSDEKPVIVIRHVSFNPVQRPASPVVWITQQANTPEGKLLIKGVAAYYGQDPATTERQIENYTSAVKALGFKLDKKGNEYYGSFPVDAGYQFCRANLHMKSMNGPETKWRAYPGKGGLSYYAVIKKPGLGKGGNWIDANIELIMLRTDKYDEVKNTANCQPQYEIYTWWCDNPSPCRFNVPMPPADQKRIKAEDNV